MRLIVLFVVAVSVCSQLETPTSDDAIAHLETIGSLTFDDETHDQQISVVWEFRALNSSMIKLPESLENKFRTQVLVSQWLENSNRRISQSLQSHLPPVIRTGRSKRFVPIVVIVVAGATGFGGGLAGAAFAHFIASPDIRKYRDEFREDAYLRALELNIELSTGARTAEYTNHLDTILNPARQPMVLNEDHVAEAVKQGTGSGRVVAVEIMNVMLKSPKSENLLELQGVIHVRSAATEYPLRRVHAGGQFTQSRQFFMKLIMKPWWIQTHKGWMEVDRNSCTNVGLLNATICARDQVYSSHVCNPSTFEECSIKLIPIKLPFVHTESLSQTTYIATTVSTYQLKNATGEFYYAVPDGGVFYISAPANSKIVVGTREIPGSGAIHQVFQPTEKIHLTDIEEETIDAEIAYIAAGSHNHLTLQERTIFNQLGIWLGNNQLMTFTVIFTLFIALIVAVVITLRRYNQYLTKKFASNQKKPFGSFGDY